MVCSHGIEAPNGWYSTLYSLFYEVMEKGEIWQFAKLISSVFRTSAISEVKLSELFRRIRKFGHEQLESEGKSVSYGQVKFSKEYITEKFVNLIRVEDLTGDEVKVFTLLEPFSLLFTPSDEICISFMQKCVFQCYKVLEEPQYYQDSDIQLVTRA